MRLVTVFHALVLYLGNRSKHPPLVPKRTRHFIKYNIFVIQKFFIY